MPVSPGVTSGSAAHRPGLVPLGPGLDGPGATNPGMPPEESRNSPSFPPSSGDVLDFSVESRFSHLNDLANELRKLPLGPVPMPAAPAPTTAERFLESAMRFQGQWYRYGGGHGPSMTRPGPVDCSGLVQQAARLIGKRLDGTADMQQRMGRPVSMRDVRPGDLVFVGRPAVHVGIYMGYGRVLHAPRTGQRVSIGSVRWFDNARRVF